MKSFLKNADGTVNNSYADHMHYIGSLGFNVVSDITESTPQSFEIADGPTLPSKRAAARAPRYKVHMVSFANIDHPGAFATVYASEVNKRYEIEALERFLEELKGVDDGSDLV